jgi:hypothetical protein
VTTQSRIAETLVEWAYQNLPAVVAPAVNFVNDPDFELGRVEITIRVGGQMPGGDELRATTRAQPLLAAEEKVIGYCVDDGTRVHPAGQPALLPAHEWHHASQTAAGYEPEPTETEE